MEKKRKYNDPGYLKRAFSNPSFERWISKWLGTFWRVKTECKNLEDVKDGGRDRALTGDRETGRGGEPRTLRWGTSHRTPTPAARTPSPAFLVSLRPHSIRRSANRSHCEKHTHLANRSPAHGHEYIHIFFLKQTLTPTNIYMHINTFTDTTQPHNETYNAWISMQVNETNTHTHNNWHIHILLYTKRSSPPSTSSPTHRPRK